MSVAIARCPAHGLHGERATCFICGGPVEQVPVAVIAGQEHRVGWQRAGQRKKVRLFQTAAAAQRHALILQGRIAEAFPDLDPDEPACCSGNDCGCDGRTRREAWAKDSARFPPLVLGPVVDRRDVGEWERVKSDA